MKRTTLLTYQKKKKNTRRYHRIAATTVQINSIENHKYRKLHECNNPGIRMDIQLRVKLCVKHIIFVIITSTTLLQYSLFVKFYMHRF